MSTTKTTAVLSGSSLLTWSRRRAWPGTSTSVTAFVAPSAEGSATVVIEGTREVWLAGFSSSVS